MDILAGFERWIAARGDGAPANPLTDYIPAAVDGGEGVKSLTHDDGDVADLAGDVPMQ
ncbi:hypothetical protein [Mycolicibacter algericus]|uniref:Uncharacterized protein n=1 Tax=Mycolicibacter algericus TaxID=1288388 RepID=A0A7I9Y9Q8_MYCAL|nr:hypothetical protein [Mycolicibacter algericus]GFG85243.1 hypothetical protein MALGJ_19190 [Mycolicibacter algericus]